MNGRTHLPLPRGVGGSLPARRVVQPVGLDAGVLWFDEDDVVARAGDEVYARGFALGDGVSISVSEGAVLARAARVAIDRRADYPLAARLLVELRHLHHELGLDFTPGFERFTASYGHSEELMRALRRVGL